MQLKIHYGLHKSGKFDEDVKHIELVLSNGSAFIIKERQDSPGYLDITTERGLTVIPRATNVVRLREER